MNSKKAKHEARLIRRMKAQQLAASEEEAANDAEMEQIRRQLEVANARGEKIELPKMSVKDRKRLVRSRPLISEEQRKHAQLGRQLLAKARGGATDCK
jgi:hypothetical protein